MMHARELPGLIERNALPIPLVCPDRDPWGRRCHKLTWRCLDRTLEVYLHPKCVTVLTRDGAGPSTMYAVQQREALDKIRIAADWLLQGIGSEVEADS